MTTSYETIHQAELIGKLTTFDRMIFHGHLLSFFRKNAFAWFLSGQHILLKDFGCYVESVTKQLRAHVESLAAANGREVRYLESARSARKGGSKEEMARQIAATEGISQGLVAIFSTLECLRSFEVRGNRKSGKLEVVTRQRKCLHYYFYFIDEEFGFMHLRIASWFPFPIQVYVNGRESLSRAMDRAGIGYERYDNSFSRIDDMAKAMELAERFGHLEWPGVLNALARKVNPFLDVIAGAGFGGYYWCLDQAEIATDIMFRDRPSLERRMPDLYEYASRTFRSEEVMRFLGRKPHGLFQGEVTTKVKKRPEGMCIRHRVKQNSIKMYDKWSVLRIETTINNPRDFKVLKSEEPTDGGSRRWVPMGKGVANSWRYLQIGTQANQRYLEALAQAEPKGEAIEMLDDLCRPCEKDGRRAGKFQPVSAADCQLFQNVMAGEYLINGFRNKELTIRLYPEPARTEKEARRRRERTSRQIRKLRIHGLVSKVQNSRLYRVSRKGFQVMSAVLRYRQEAFPAGFLAGQSL